MTKNEIKVTSELVLDNERLITLKSNTETNAPRRLITPAIQFNIPGIFVI